MIDRNTFLSNYKNKKGFAKGSAAKLGILALPMFECAWDAARCCYRNNQSGTQIFIGATCYCVQRWYWYPILAFS